MIPYGRKREKRERRLEQLLALPQLLPHHRQIPRCTCNQDTWFGRVVWHGKACIFGCESELLSYYCAETSYPRTGTNVNDMLCRKRAEATS